MRVVGVDEVGRGSLAGPLIAAAVALDFSCLTLRGRRALTGLDDSKRLSAPERERLAGSILLHADQVAISMVSPRTIDARGLHVANIAALTDALNGLTGSADACWVDGFQLGDDAAPHAKLIGGDRTSAAVAAAGVVAKTARDRLMRNAMATAYPEYGFESHVGYGTPEHLAALAEHGPSAIHRRCFRPVAYTEMSLFTTE